MIKAKLLPYSLDSNWEDLFTILEYARYTDEESRGIKVNDFSKKEIKATFYEKIVYTESIDDPINGLVEYQRQTFFNTAFIIYNNGILAIINPSKRTSSFLTYLLSKTKFKFTINECKLNIESTSNVLKSIFDEFKTIKVSYNQFNILEDIRCAMALTSSKDIEMELGKLNIPLPKTPNKLSFVGSFLCRAMRGEINENGTISISHPNYEVILDKITSRREEIFF